MNAKNRIVVADDHTILREGVVALLSSDGKFEVVAQAENGKDAVRAVGAHRPELLIIDLSMPKTNGTEAIREIKKRYPETRVIALTVHNTDEYVSAAFKAGAEGYLLKDDCYGELQTAIHSVLNGKRYISPGIADRVLTGFLGQMGGAGPVTAWDTLSDREREIIKLVAEGYKNREIATHLSISAKTVEKHRANLMRKLKLRSAADLAAYAIRKGLVTS